MRLHLLALALLTTALAGCSGGPDGGGEGGDGKDGDGSGASRFATIPTLYLRADGSTTWLSTEAGSAGELAMSSAGSSSAVRREATFTLDPPLATDVATGGSATVHLEIGAFTTTTGPGPYAEVTLRVGDTEQTSTSTSTSADHVFDVPTSIPAGTEVSVTVCVCRSPPDVQTYMLRHGGGSTVTFTAPGDEAGSSGLTSAPVTVRQEGNQWIAEQSYTGTLPLLQDGVGAEVRTVNGEVVLQEGTPGIQARLWGRGDTEQAARDRLAEVTLDYSASPTAYSLVAQHTRDGGNKGADLTVTVADGTDHGEVDLRTVNGDITLDGVAAETLTTTATNGAILVVGAVAGWQGSTENGDIDGQLEVQAGSVVDLSTTNGEIVLGLVRDGAAVDVEGTTVNGEVTLTLSDTQPVGTQTRTHKHVRSPGYDEAAVQFQATLSTTNGEIEVTES